jgi:hypothetical protein
VKAPAVTLKLAVSAPAGTATEEGVVSRLLLSFSRTLSRITGARLSFTVQVLDPPGSTAAGLQRSEVSAICGITIKEAC